MRFKLIQASKYLTNTLDILLFQKLQALYYKLKKLTYEKEFN